ncbi:MAG: WYL domain-containing protein [Oscillospiraceae bacterium]|nr:WYL domain-containing protein [Oscillospiraceae bacterium]
MEKMEKQDKKENVKKEPKHPIKITRDDVINYIVENSSEGHMLSRNEIYSAMYKICTDSPIVDHFSDHTVLSAMSRTLDPEEGVLGMQLTYGLMLKKKDFPQTGKNERTSEIKQYYAQGPLTDSQVRILRDAVIVYPFAEEKETGKIVNALNKLTPVYNRETYDLSKINAVKYTGEYYRNIEEIHKALSPKQYGTGPEKSRKSDLKQNDYEEKMQKKPVTQIRFRYCEYNEKKELIPKKLKYPNQGETDLEIRRVNPVKLMWANGYYYLVGFYKNKKGEEYYINYRVDRMKDVECTSDPAELPDPQKFDLYKYKFSNPVMYSGSKHSVRLLCEKWLMNNIIDTFGFDVIVNQTEDDKLLVDLLQVSYDGVMMWALEYWSGCEILEPPELRSKMQEAAESLGSMYKRAPSAYVKRHRNPAADRSVVITE